MIKRSLSALAIACIAMGTGHASPTIDAPVELRALLPGDPARPGPGCAMAVFRDGRLQSLVSDGYANLDTMAPLDGDTRFYAASLSKQFSALALVQLSLQGKVDLDGDVRQWLPELPRYDATITPRMLLQHRSGILDSLSLVRLGAPSGSAGSTSRADTLALVLVQPRTNFTPGTETYYSNGAFLLVAELIQRVSGIGYADYINHHILAPMGMRDSYMLDGDPRPSAHLAHGYRPVAGGYEIRDTFPRYGGSGGLMLTLNDLARYEYDIEHGHRVWTPEVRRVMEEPGTLSNGKPAHTQDRAGGLAYAAGLMVGQRDGRHIVEHSGGADAFQHMYSRVPAEKFAVAALCNFGKSGAAEKVHAAINLLLTPTAEQLAQLPATGLYRGDSLPARYLLWRNGDDRASLAILPDGNTRPSSVVELQRGKDGIYSGEGLRLEAPDARTLVFGTDRARGLRATRIDH